MGARRVVAWAVAAMLLAACAGNDEQLADVTAPPATSAATSTDAASSAGASSSGEATTASGTESSDAPTSTDPPTSIDAAVETFLAEEFFGGSDLDPTRSTLAALGFDAAEQSCIATAVDDASWSGDVIDVSDIDQMELADLLAIAADLDGCHPTAALIASNYEQGASWLACLRGALPTTVSFVDVIEVREMGSRASAYATTGPLLSSAAERCIPTPLGTLMAQQIIGQATARGGASSLPGAEACVSEGLATFGWSEFFAVGNRTAGELAPESMVAVLDRCAPVGTLLAHSLVDPESTDSIVAEFGGSYVVPDGAEVCLRTTLDTAGWRAMFAFSGAGSGGLPPALSDALDRCLPVGAVMAHVLTDPESPDSLIAAFGNDVRLPDDAKACLTTAMASATWIEISSGESVNGRSVVTDALDACVPYGPLAAQALAQQPGRPSTPEAQAAYIQCLSTRLADLSWADTGNLRPDRGPIPDAQKACNAP